MQAIMDIRIIRNNSLYDRRISEILSYKKKAFTLPFRPFINVDENCKEANNCKEARKIAIVRKANAHFCH